MKKTTGVFVFQKYGNFESILHTRASDGTNT